MCINNVALDKPSNNAIDANYPVYDSTHDHKVLASVHVALNKIDNNETDAESSSRDI